MLADSSVFGIVLGLYTSWRYWKFPGILWASEQLSPVIVSVIGWVYLKIEIPFSEGGSETKPGMFVLDEECIFNYSICTQIFLLLFVLKVCRRLYYRHDLGWLCKFRCYWYFLFSVYVTIASYDLQLK